MSMAVLEKKNEPFEQEVAVEVGYEGAANSDVHVTVQESEGAPSVSTQPAAHHLPLFRGICHFSCQFLKTAAAAAWWMVCSTARYLRYHPTHALFTAIMFGVLFVLLETGSQIHDRFILSQISDKTIDEIISASRFTRQYQSEEATHAGQEFLRVGAPTWAQRESVRAVLYQARKSGLSIADQAVLLATVEVESGFNPMAHAPSTSACGLFQFVRETGRTFGLSAEDCMDPWMNAQAGVQHYLSLYERIHRTVDVIQGPEKLFKTFELSYYLHHDGPNSSNPNDDVKAVVLSGVQFLLHVNGVLEREAASKDNAPTFSQAFAEKLWQTISPYVRMVKGELTPLRSA